MIFWRTLVGIAALWAVMSMTYPFGWDQGILSWAGGVVLNGGIPYQDAWDMKGPVAYYVFALAQAIFGVNLWGIRILDLVLLTSAATGLGTTVTRMADATTGRWSAIVFVLWYASQSYWHTAQPDGWAAMLLVLALLPVLTRPEQTPLWRYALAGAAVGLAALIKPVYLAFLALPFISLWSSAGRQIAVSSAMCFAGCLLPIGLGAAWFFRLGALDDLIAVYLRYPASAYADVGTVGFVEIGRGIVAYLFQTPVIASGLPVVVVGGVVMFQKDRSLGLTLIGWLLLVIAIVALQGRFFAYHWLPIIPPAVVLGAVGLHSVLPRARALGLAVLAVAVVSCLAPIVLEESRFVAWVSGFTDRDKYYDGFGEPGDDMRAVAWLEREGKEGKVFVFGWNTDVAWLSRREIVSRFGFSMPLLLGERLQVRLQYREEVLAALHADPPAYIIVGTQSSRILRRSMSIADFPELADFVTGAYKKLAEFGVIQIYERQASKASRSN